MNISFQTELLFLKENIGPGAPQRTSAYIPYFNKEIDQELRRGLLLTLLIKSCRNHKGNKPGAPWRTSAYILD